MSLATLAQNQAASAIRKFGAQATLAIVTSGTYNPVTGSAAAGVQSVATAALLDATSLQGIGAKFGADLVRSGDLKATIPAKGLASDPRPGDRLTVRGETYQIVAVRPVMVQDSAVTYELLVRR